MMTKHTLIDIMNWNEFGDNLELDGFSFSELKKIYGRIDNLACFITDELDFRKEKVFNDELNKCCEALEEMNKLKPGGAVWIEVDDEKEEMISFTKIRNALLMSIK